MTTSEMVRPVVRDGVRLCGYCRRPLSGFFSGGGSFCSVTCRSRGTSPGPGAAAEWRTR